MKIGIVDLDTSHPSAWIPIEREMGHEVIGVWDGGSVHPKGYAEKFAAEHQISKVYSSLAQMALDVDCAIIHGCDWDSHVEKARFFIEANKAVLIDKPLAGNLRDLRQFQIWADRGARITGGSALRFCRETRDWLAKPILERGAPHTVICGCAEDDFNYAIHAYSLLCGIMGIGLESVLHIKKNVQRHIQLNWESGAMGMIIMGQQEGWLPFYATIVTEKTVFQFQPDTACLYRAILEAALPYLSGQKDSPLVPMKELMAPELAALAARQSWSNGDHQVSISHLNEFDACFDGVVFAAEYRRKKYGA